MDKAYTMLLTLELCSIGIKYQGSESNPFQESTPTMFLFLTSIFCHVVASTADISLQTTMIVFHLSGLVACETLLWILLPHFLHCYIINLFLLLVTSLCFSNCIIDITNLFRSSTTATPSDDAVDPQEADNA